MTGFVPRPKRRYFGDRFYAALKPLLFHSLFFIPNPVAQLRVLALAVPTLNSITPCFIADSLQSSLDFYQSKLGFENAYKGGGNGPGEDFWAFVRRDGVMISLKAISPEIHPQPNHSRHEWARWDAYIHTSDPDSLYEEYVSRAVPMHQHLKDTEDGLRA